MKRIVARLWKLIRGPLQWRVLWFAHAKFMIGVRPAQRLAPEVADRLGAVAGDRPDEAGVGEELVAGLDHAELVAVRIGEDDVAVLRGLADVDVPRAEFQCPVHRLPLGLRGGAGQVEVRLVLAGLGLPARREAEPEAVGVGGQEPELRGCGARFGLSPVQQVGPEAGQVRRVGRVEADR